ncbi:MAG: aminoacyl-tRNA deacylase [Deltaproteobacteria bacterium]|nr:aminoacyl-tRNA deacylase [Deltaproteobacteria bacterium]
MAKERIPATQAIRQLKKHKIKFVPRPYKYEEKGGTRVSARELRIDEFLIIKTLVMEDDRDQALIILMHGSCEVSLKHLARQLKVKQINSCPVEKAERLTGYQTGGISPFGTKQTLPIYVEESILALEKICINGGRRGLLVEIDPLALVKILHPKPVSVAV